MGKKECNRYTVCWIIPLLLLFLFQFNGYWIRNYFLLCRFWNTTVHNHSKTNTKTKKTCNRGNTIWGDNEVGRWLLYMYMFRASWLFDIRFFIYLYIDRSHIQYGKQKYFAWYNIIYSIHPIIYTIHYIMCDVMWCGVVFYLVVQWLIELNSMPLNRNDIDVQNSRSIFPHNVQDFEFISIILNLNP